jgi:hypothetical protein
LATTARRPVTTADVDAAVRREYRKAGAVCPLRPTNGRATTGTVW